MFSFPSQMIKDNLREWESTNHRGSKTNLVQGSTSHWGIGADHCHHSRCSWPDPSAVSSRHQTDNHQQWQRSKPNQSSRTNLALGSTRQDTGSHQGRTPCSWASETSAALKPDSLCYAMRKNFPVSNADGVFGPLSIPLCCFL